ncbi:hypothetical protein CROQUDRAFT_96498 [Cronartium quercuum f. sp. fusiforme G11]|uniref:Uncharacterized protein n=1 Tax=Cronartium quercuum f. sp. fusiforme G11 TaxID=708437 RepID=A0A9P6NFZ2_9BASI|nr:hypothetical protein CROQUDRAFT_96498 [Cronartium quercuum f. sp. fusiforme G11]
MSLRSQLAEPPKLLNKSYIVHNLTAARLRGTKSSKKHAEKWWTWVTLSELGEKLLVKSNSTLASHISLRNTGPVKSKPALCEILSWFYSEFHSFEIIIVHTSLDFITYASITVLKFPTSQPMPMDVWMTNIVPKKGHLVQELSMLISEEADIMASADLCYKSPYENASPNEMEFEDVRQNLNRLLIPIELAEHRSPAATFDNSYRGGGQHLGNKWLPQAIE